MNDCRSTLRPRDWRTPGRALTALACAAALAALTAGARAQTPAPTKRPQRAAAAPRPVPEETMLRIIRAEDERRWDADDLGALLGDASPSVRARAVAPLVGLLQTDRDATVRTTAAFALGEIESPQAADALINAARPGQASAPTARAVEALGKIAAALPRDDQANAKKIGDAIIAALKFEAARRSAPNREAALLALTAALRARPAEAGRVVAEFLTHTDARVRADAANTLARLRSKDGAAQLRTLLANDPDAVVRANAARALGAAEDKEAYDPLLDRALNDRDERVRTSALRALGLLRDARAGEALTKRGDALFAAYRAAKTAAPAAHPSELNELLEVCAALGRVLANSTDQRALTLLRALREAEGWAAPEAEIAFARIAPAQYMREKPFGNLYLRAAENKLSWQATSAVAQGLAELAQVSGERAGNSMVSVQADAQLALRALLNDRQTPALAAPDVLRAVAAFKPLDLPAVMREQLKSQDVIVRATAAELLGAGEPESETALALVMALPVALRDEMNDAALAVLDALAKQKRDEATAALRSALDSPDYLIRVRAASLLRASGQAGSDERIQTVAVRYHLPEYRRALARASRRTTAVVTTDKGQFTMELLAADAPLTVDNFVELARRGFFNNVAFHRVVPNFVIQGGDPRGDGNGGPGYQIRCEINFAPYDRGAVGMALSGKDTGGSQWFVTHSPQPHLDGGYTVFGRVVSGMEVVDRIARGDRIRAVAVVEAAKRK
jgi:cyclophilin family peptidyl-prolyl cis-trans isomerase/HEAT repeat protein